MKAPQGRLIPGSPQRLPRQTGTTGDGDAQQDLVVARYRLLRDRYQNTALAIIVFLCAAIYMATQPLEGASTTSIGGAEQNSSRETLAVISNEADNSSTQAIAGAYARFGEEVRREAERQVEEIRAALRSSDLRASGEVTAASALLVNPPERQQNLIQQVYRIIKRYSPRHQNPRSLAEAIVLEAAAQQYDALFVAAVIKSESAFNTLAQSHKGAQGLMQIMPATGRWLARDAEIKGNLTDPGHNLSLGIRYLKHLESQYNGDRVFTLIAYNWGPGHVESASDGKRKIPPEVVTYAVKILNDYRRWRGAGL